MKKPEEFSFGNDSVAEAYDNYLVPVLFEPWADQLIRDYQPWAGKHVLDLATGTGVVAKQLASHVNPNGKITALDINSQMLALAKKRCADESANMEFIEGSADALGVSDNSVDVVVCQQGFQFFPDKKAVAQEIYRVLKSDGKIIVSTWCPVSECQLFGAICTALEMMWENEISHMMRIPFDFMTQQELAAPFESAGFNNVQVSQQEQDLIIDGGISGAIEMAYATPIGPKLRELTNEQQNDFRNNLTEIILELSPDKSNMGRMVSNALSAGKD